MQSPASVHLVEHSPSSAPASLPPAAAAMEAEGAFEVAGITSPLPVAAPVAASSAPLASAPLVAGAALVGASVRKHFAAHGWFTGVVSEFRPAAVEVSVEVDAAVGSDLWEVRLGTEESDNGVTK